jgi:putative Ca2+/H+ antiporter (TMEM165/GDT1 family)
MESAMPAFLFSLIACLLVTMAGREQLRLARLASVLGVRTGLLVAVIVSSAVTSGIAAWAGRWLATVLADSARVPLAAIALLLAASQLAVLRARPAPKEPTWSFGAVLIVLLLAQICDATRLLVLALVLQTGDAVAVALGGALGSGLALIASCLAGAKWELRMPHRALSCGVAAVLLTAALLMASPIY